MKLKSVYFILIAIATVFLFSSFVYADRTAVGTGSGSGGGTFSTTTSSVPGQLLNYSNNNTYIVTVGGTSTSTAEFWQDPNSNRLIVRTGDLGIGSTSPESKVTIRGTSALTGLLTIASTTGARIFNIANTGRVTLGQSTVDNAALQIRPESGFNVLSAFNSTGSYSARISAEGRLDLSNYSNGSGAVLALLNPTAFAVGNRNHIGMLVNNSLNEANTVGILNVSTLDPTATAFESKVEIGYASQLDTSPAGVQQPNRLVVFDRRGITIPEGGFIVPGGGTITGSSTNVGIGTTTPAAKLDIAGTNNATVPLLQLSSVASFATTTRFVVTNSGNVGLGTTSPAATLDMTGNLQLNSDSTANNGFMLMNGLRFISTFGPEASVNTNTFVGTGAANFTLSGASGQNAGFGSQVMTNLTTGIGNSTLGFRALSSVTTGASNTAVGGSAGRGITTGSNNTFVGAVSGFIADGVTTPNNLTNATAIGYNAQVTASNSLILGGTGASSVNVGIGTTSPNTRLTVAGVITSTSTAPTLSSCGTSPTVVGNSNWGEITTGATATGCTVTFVPAFQTFGSCVISNQSPSLVNAMTYTDSRTGFTVAQTGLGGSIINYKCDGI
jgi:hypothetical protein